jgi:hypothetical protein
MSRHAFVHVLTLAAVVLLMPACNKEEDTRAIVTIKRDGVPVQGAYVKLYANPIPPQASDFTRMTKEGLTDAKGQVTFDYTGLYEQGQAGLAVLDIASFKDSAVGYGIIRIIEEETTEETVDIEYAY